MLQILHVDDDSDDLEITKLRLSRLRRDLKIEWAKSAEEAMERLNTEEYHCVICDYQIPEMDGLQILNSLRKSGNNIPFILLSNQTKEDLVHKAFELGADDYYTKEPGFAHYDRLLHCIEKTVESKQLLSKYRKSWVSMLRRIQQEKTRAEE